MNLNKIKSGFLLLTLLCFISVSAETDPKAQEILKGVSAKYKSYKSLKADFTIEIEDQKNNRKEEQKGTLTVKGRRSRM